MELKKYKLADIAKIEISGVDKKTIEGETPVRLCNFVDVYYNWAITKEKAKSFMAASAKYNPQIQISAESETKRSIFREKDKTKRSKKESAQHSKSRNKSFVMTSVSAL